MMRKIILLGLLSIVALTSIFLYMTFNSPHTPEPVIEDQIAKDGGQDTRMFGMFTALDEEGISRLYELWSSGEEKIRYPGVEMKEVSLSPDNKMIAYVRTVDSLVDQLVVSEADNLTYEQSYSPIANSLIVGKTTWHADAKTVIFEGFHTAEIEGLTREEVDILALDTQTGDQSLLATKATSPVVAKDGSVYFVTDDGIYVVNKNADGTWGNQSQVYAFTPTEQYQIPDRDARLLLSASENTIALFDPNELGIMLFARSPETKALTLQEVPEIPSGIESMVFDGESMYAVREVVSDNKIEYIHGVLTEEAGTYSPRTMSLVVINSSTEI
jgi:hypothetical protein